MMKGALLLLLVLVSVKLGQTDTNSELYAGCYTTIEGKISYGASRTISHCITMCKQSFAYAALRRGDECYCARHVTTQSFGCYDDESQICEKNITEVCGSQSSSSSGAYSVYRVCPSGWYGNDCSNECHSSCAGRGCSPSSLNCLDLCPAGKTDDDCSQDCPAGKYGPSCRGLCPSGCPYHCDPRLGYCTQPCTSGYGPFCVDTCQQDKYRPVGPCPFCSHCMDIECIGDGGDCYYQCPKNWNGTACKECAVGYWGPPQCQKCPDHCGEAGCSQDRGICHGCEPGYYGKECNIACSGNCNNLDCQQHSGNCMRGCKDGYYGDDCTLPCHCWDGSPCEAESGVCKAGCEDRWTGDDCSVPVTGSMVVFVLGGLLAALCLLAIVAAICCAAPYYKAQRKQKYENNIHGNVTSHENPSYVSDMPTDDKSVAYEVLDGIAEIQPRQQPLRQPITLPPNPPPNQPQHQPYDKWI